MKKILILTLLLVLSLTACSQEDNTKDKDNTKTTQDAEKSSDSSENEKMVEEFTKKELVKKEEDLELKDLPVATFDLTSDSNQKLILKNEDSKKEDIEVFLEKDKKTPVYFDENLSSIIITGDSSATIKAEKHTKTEADTLSTGLYKVTFTDDIKPGNLVFKTKDKDASVTFFSKYGNVDTLELKKEGSTFATEEITLMAGDTILLNGKDFSIIDTVQEKIDEKEKTKEK